MVPVCWGRGGGGGGEGGKVPCILLLLASPLQETKDYFPLPQTLETSQGTLCQDDQVSHLPVITSWVRTGSLNPLSHFNQ